MSLPTDDKNRKALPIFRGPLMYFPDAMLEVARLCKIGNDQHNPGEPMHWARGKSTEQLDTALRHMMDHGTGTPIDTDGVYHMAKAAWRCLAELQLAIERARELAATPARKPKVGDRVRVVAGQSHLGWIGATGEITMLARPGERAPWNVRVNRAGLPIVAFDDYELEVIP